jgi:hypothetical protein
MSANEVSYLAEEYGLGPLQGIKMTLLKGAARPTGKPIKRNPASFPSDFMFQLNKSEKQKVATNCDHLARLKYSPALPYAFTEHGALMLGNVLRSDRAIDVSLHVLRTFVGLREMLSSHKELAVKLETLERKVGTHDQAIAGLIDAIRQLMAEPKQKRRPIGFVLTEHPPGNEGNK